MEIQEQNFSRTRPISFVPEPSDQYRRHRKMMQTQVEPGRPVSPDRIPLPKQPKIPIPFPLLIGPRVLVYKQDPSVAEIGIRKAWLPTWVATGPRDARFGNGSPGIPAVNHNAFGDFIQIPGSDAFDAVHMFAVVRMTLTMCERARGAMVPWQWNSLANVDTMAVFPHGLPDVANAYYSRNDKALKFGHFIPVGTTQRVYTCRSLDICAHECGHAVLDGLKPGWLNWGNPPQTGGLHESWGDICAIFLALSQFDQVEAVIAQTKANLHDKTFLADMAEEFGLALGRPNSLRNADNNLKLSEVGTQVHALSQVFTGAIYDILADIFAFERNQRPTDDPAAVLYETGQYVFRLVLRGIAASPAAAATYADVVNQMLQISASDGKPVEYRNFIRNQFTVREVVVSPTPLTADYQAGVLQPMANLVSARQDVIQDRRGCCGTMNLPEYLGEQQALAAEIEEFKKALRDAGPTLKPGGKR